MKETDLYRHFDANGTLLYVGISYSALARFAGHKSSSSWIGKIAQMTIETFPTREAALAAEKEAIRVEGPLFNIKGKKGMPAFPTEFADSYLDDTGWPVLAVVLEDEQCDQFLVEFNGDGLCEIYRGENRYLMFSQDLLMKVSALIPRADAWYARSAKASPMKEVLAQ